MDEMVMVGREGKEGADLNVCEGVLIGEQSSHQQGVEGSEVSDKFTWHSLN